MPKILQMFKRRTRRKGRFRRALGLPEKTAAANVIAFHPILPEIEEEYPDYEIVSRWLKLADEMLGSAEFSQIDDYHDRNSRKKA